MLGFGEESKLTEEQKVDIALHKYGNETNLDVFVNIFKYTDIQVWLEYYKSDGKTQVPAHKILNQAETRINYEKNITQIYIKWELFKGVNYFITSKDELVGYFSS